MSKARTLRRKMDRWLDTSVWWTGYYYSSSGVMYVSSNIKFTEWPRGARTIEDAIRIAVTAAIHGWDGLVVKHVVMG